MTDPNGRVCPECAVPRAGDGTPSCVCTLRASDALRDARTAEAAAAEDFDPLRIRPYVELGVKGAGGDPSGAEGGGGDKDQDEEASARTMRLGRVPAEDTVALFRVEHGVAGPGAGRGAGAGGGAGAVGETRTDRVAVSDEEPGRRRRRTALLAAAGVVVAVVAAGFVSGLFSYDAPARDGALPDEVRASVPDPSLTSASASASAPRASRSAVAVAPSTTSPSPSASASTASASPSSSASPSRSPGASQSPESPAATGSTAPGQGQGASPSNGQLSATLRRGDQGPEVTELQLRLRQLFLFNGKADGSYSRQVEDAVRRYQWARGIMSDEQGVYGRATRASLESETREP